MSVTATKTRTIRAALNTSKEGEMDDALVKLQLGNMLVPMKVTFASLSSAAAQNITTAAAAAAATMGSFSPLLTNPDDIVTLPAILVVGTLRVTAGAAAAGARFVTDVGGTPSTTVATISDDGKTLTFENTVTGFVLEYIPRAPIDVVNTLFAPAS